MNPVVVAGLPVAACCVAASGRSAREARIADRLAIGGSSTTRLPTIRRDDVLWFVVAALLGWVVARGVGVVLGVTCRALVRAVRARRARTISPIVIEERFADGVGALAAAVRSGASLTQAIRYAASEAEPPVREEFGQLVTDLDTGIALDHALRSWASSHPTPLVELVVGALELHRRSGGDLPVVLDQVAATIRDRVSIAREVRSLTAQARLSAWILGLLPVGFFAFLWLTSRRDIEGALSTPIGIGCILLGLLLELGAFAWIRTLLVVE